jgi:hypothetical protein
MRGELRKVLGEPRKMADPIRRMLGESLAGSGKP